MCRLGIAGAVLALTGFVNVTSVAADVPKTKSERVRFAAKTVDEVLHQEATEAVEDRAKLLKSALELAPNNETALGLSGYVYDAKTKKWLKYDEATDKARSDERLENYRTFRSKTPNTEAGQMDLAKWCLRKKMNDQATAHLCMVLEINPNNQEARALLGQKQVNGAWVSEADIAATEANERKMEAALKKWTPKLEKIRDKMDGSKRQSEYAKKELDSISDPEAAWAIESVFCRGGGETGKIGIAALKKLKGRESSACLTKMALLAPWEDIGQDAAKALASQSKYDYVPQLLSLFQTTIQSSAQMYQSDDGRLLCRQIFFAQGNDQKDVLVVDNPYQHVVATSTTTAASRADFNSVQGSAQAKNRMEDEIQQKIAQKNAMEKFQADAARKVAQRNAEVAKHNIEAASVNVRVCSVLGQAISSPSLEDEPLSQNEKLDAKKKGESDRKAKNDLTDENVSEEGDLIENESSVAAEGESKGGEVAKKQKKEYERNPDSKELTDEYPNGGAANGAKRNNVYYRPQTPEDWTKWWNKYTETYVPETKVRTAYVSRPTKVSETQRNVTLAPPEPRRYECLAGDTPVWTERGVTPIVNVVEGDRVFACDPETGALALKTVLKKTVRAKENTGEMVTIRAEGISIAASGGHVFWIAGQGWIKARNVKPGMRLHTISGTVTVETVGVHAAEETFNLVVADYHSFFIGESGCLTHDNTLRRPTNMIVPGLSRGKPASK